MSDEPLAADRVFDLLGNPVRLDILRTLWATTKDVGFEQGDPLTFSELYERVDVDDSGNFNYHLDRLVGQFVERTERGYRIRRAGVFVIRAIRAGTVTEDPAFGPVEVAAACPRCGGTVDVQYRNERVLTRCQACEGMFGAHEYPSGTITALTYPPAALRDRDPQAIFETAHRRYCHGIRTMLDGFCPECTGTVTVEIALCPDHETTDGRLCPHSRTAIDDAVVGVCDICACYRVFSAATALLDHPRIAAAFGTGDDTPGFPRMFAEPPTWACDVVATDPPRFAYRVPLGDERLAIELAADLSIVS